MRRRESDGERASEARFRRLVYAMVRRVPAGRVVTYGQVAALVGHPRAARAVGTALARLRGDEVDDVPWQRVIGSAGRCSHRDGFWADVQRELLEGERVEFDARGRLDLRRLRWPGPRRAAVSSGDPAHSTAARRRRSPSAAARRRR